MQVKAPTPQPSRDESDSDGIEILEHRSTAPPAPVTPSKKGATAAAVKAESTDEGPMPSGSSLLACQLREG